MIPDRGSLERRTLTARLTDRARFIRLETLRLAKIAGAGHYTSTFSAAELLSVLYYAELRYDPQWPQRPERDRFILSKGHAAIGLYPVLADVGFFDASLLDDYTRLGSPFGDHPDMKGIPGIDFSSGSLGHGMSVAVGMALSARLAKTDARVWCMVGDGELHEGQVWEAAMAAAHYGLGNLTVIVDRNGLCIDGVTDDIMGVEPIEAKFAAFGWETRRFDGHDIDEILDVFGALPATGGDRPQVLVADTVKGQGVKRMEHSPDWHVGNLAGADYDDVVAEIEAGSQPVAGS